MEEKTRIRFENARAEGIIDALSNWYRGYELEEIGHEEDSLRILKVLEEAGWMKHLYPAWTSAKADGVGLEQIREVLNQLQIQGVNPDTSTASMTLLTAKMSHKELSELKKLLVRPGFVEEWNSLDHRAKEFAKVLTSKQVATPSTTWKLLNTSDPEAVLWLGFTSKSAPVQEKFHNFFSVCPEARQKIPYAIMQEMRITPEIEGYQALLQELFFQLIDGKLETEEQIRAFLEPFSPPAPPPPVTVRRTRGKKASEAKARAREEEEEELEELPEGIVPKLGLDDVDKLDDEEEDEDLDDEPVSSKVKEPKGKPESKAKPAAEPKHQVKAEAKPAVAAKSAAKAPEKKPAEPKPAPKAAPVKAAPAKVVPAKPVPTKAPEKKAVASKQPQKAAARPVEKKPVVAAKKGAPAKHVLHKAPAKPVAHSKAAPAAKKSVAKPAPKPMAKKAAKPAVKGRPAAKPAKAVPSKAAKKKKR